MRLTVLSITCGLGLLVSTSAMAGDPQPMMAATSNAGQASQQLICRAPVHEGQLLLQAKQCYTKAEWQARRIRMQNSIRDFQMRNLTANNGI